MISMMMGKTWAEHTWKISHKNKKVLTALQLFLLMKLQIWSQLPLLCFILYNNNRRSFIVQSISVKKDSMQTWNQTSLWIFVYFVMSKKTVSNYSACSNWKAIIVFKSTELFWWNLTAQSHNTITFPPSSCYWLLRLPEDRFKEIHIFYLLQEYGCMVCWQTAPLPGTVREIIRHTLPLSYCTHQHSPLTATSCRHLSAELGQKLRDKVFFFICEYTWQVSSCLSIYFHFRVDVSINKCLPEWCIFSWSPVMPVQRPATFTSSNWFGHVSLCSSSLTASVCSWYRHIITSLKLVNWSGKYSVLYITFLHHVFYLKYRVN